MTVGSINNRSFLWIGAHNNIENTKISEYELINGIGLFFEKPLSVNVSTITLKYSNDFSTISFNISIGTPLSIVIIVALILVSIVVLYATLIALKNFYLAKLEEKEKLYEENIALVSEIQPQKNPS